MQDFRQLHVWQKAHELTLTVYRSTARFPAEERYGLVSQMRSAAVSIESNIAEGCGRSSDADFARFLHNSAGSANELECQIMIARDLGYLEPDRAGALSGLRSEVKKMLVALIASMNSDGGPARAGEQGNARPLARDWARGRPRLPGCPCQLRAASCEPPLPSRSL